MNRRDLLKTAAASILPVGLATQVLAKETPKEYSGGIWGVVYISWSNNGNWEQKVFGTHAKCLNDFKLAAFREIPALKEKGGTILAWWGTLEEGLKACTSVVDISRDSIIFYTQLSKLFDRVADVKWVKYDDKCKWKAEANRLPESIYEMNI